MNDAQSRRCLPPLAAVVLAALLGLLSACDQSVEQQSWNHYKSYFLNEGGSIVDAVNGNIRHSEGQGVGMLLATANKDRNTFDKIWNWTQQNLQIRQHDKLLAWRWTPSTPHITDFNNASDGDILIAWSLIRAHRLWGDEAYKVAASEILKDIRTHLVIYKYGYMLLLPGQYGFIKEHEVLINLSYWVFPALVDFESFEPDEAAWDGLIKSGLKLSQESLFGAWKLSPDWLLVGNTLTLASQFPKRFGLDAVRIPLYLKWAGYDQHPALKNAAHFWSQFTNNGAWPEWAGLEDTNVHMADKVQGIHAISNFIINTQQHDSTHYFSTEKDDVEYYQSTLLLFSHLAQRETRR